LRCKAASLGKMPSHIRIWVLEVIGFSLYLFYFIMALIVSTPY
jgi:hypothetical protein